MWILWYACESYIGSLWLKNKFSTFIEHVLHLSFYTRNNKERDWNHWEKIYNYFFVLVQNALRHFKSPKIWTSIIIVWATLDTCVENSKMCNKSYAHTYHGLHEQHVLKAFNFTSRTLNLSFWGDCTVTVALYN